MKPKLHDEFGNSIKHKLPNPSDKLIDESKLLTPEKRIKIIDSIAGLVNKNTFYTINRSSMCLQFAILLKYWLSKENIDSKVMTGTATYTSASVVFSWEHFWVETADELIDCNIDSAPYHHEVPEGIEPYNYWGDKQSVPNDRSFNHVLEFTELDIQKLEAEDEETIVWKNEIDNSR